MGCGGHRAGRDPGPFIFSGLGGAPHRNPGGVLGTALLCGP